MLSGMKKFIDNSPCNFYAVEEVSRMLSDAGYELLCEGKRWKIDAGGKYFVKRNGTALIAFQVPTGEWNGFNIVSSHCDSPCFKLKDNAEIDVAGKYTKLSVEGYGGMIRASWFDRPLSIAGRIMVKTANGIENKLVKLDEDVCMFVNQAIHMNRDVNKGYEYKLNVDMVPLWGEGSRAGDLIKYICEKNDIVYEDVLSQELFVYNRQKCTVWGKDGAFVSGPRLDDLECAYVSAKAFMDVENIKNVPVYCLYDNEEVGSLTKQGAASTFLRDTLLRIVMENGGTEVDYLRAINNSFMVSADNAHAVHPNYPEKSDANNRCFMNEGIVVKFQGGQKYATDAASSAVFYEICRRAGVPYQTFYNRSDMPGGSTLGNISSAQVPVATVDIGLAQLAMHSCYETAGVKDPEYLYDALRVAYGMKLMKDENGTFKL